MASETCEYPFGQGVRILGQSVLSRTSFAVYTNGAFSLDVDIANNDGDVDETDAQILSEFVLSVRVTLP